MSTSDGVGNTDIISEIKRRYKEAEEYEAAWRRRAVDDLNFFLADSYNHGQWSDADYQARSGQYGGSPRPCLTINKTAQHVFQVENDARQNQMGIKVNATGFGATEKAADVLEGIIRHIEYQSNAQQNAYNCAIQGQVRQGIGWIHIRTEYLKGQDSFDQDFYIESVPDPLSVYSDPNTKEPDHSDMEWAMLISTMPRSEYEREHGDLPGDDQPLSIMHHSDERASNGWIDKDIVRVAHYYRRNEARDTLWAVPALPEMGIPGGNMRQSEMPAGLVDFLRETGAQSRPVAHHQVECIILAGDKIIDQTDTVFQHIPLVPWIGVESVVKGRLDRKGLVRSLIDPQRMFNYSASAFVEGLAMQIKPQWLADARAVEGFEREWGNSNVSNAAFLPYNAIELDSALPIAPPQRLDPATGSPGHMQAMQNADLQMQMVTGQYQAEMGAPGNERSGRAINERQRQSDTANYHYTDNQGMALRLTGRIIVGAIPKVYDTHRATQVMGIDGSQQSAVIDPGAQQSAQVSLPPGAQPPQGADIEQQLMIEGAILAINPTIGRYDVEADVGPAFATRRQETANALLQLFGMNNELAAKGADILFKALDFPLADELADRFKPTTDDPQAAALQQQLQQSQQMIAQLTQQLKSKEAEQQHTVVKDAMAADTNQYKAETDRMAAIGSTDPEALRALVHQLVQDALRHGGQPPEDGAMPAVQDGPPGPVPRLPSSNPPGGVIHAPNPVTGAVDV